ncbi:MAG: hypothetical protein AAF915_18170 [Cyanobacteria bacterium P01_D01_bin.50]
MANSLELGFNLSLRCSATGKVFVAIVRVGLTAEIVQIIYIVSMAV